MVSSFHSKCKIKDEFFWGNYSVIFVNVNMFSKQLNCRFFANIILRVTSYLKAVTIVIEPKMMLAYISRKRNKESSFIEFSNKNNLRHILNITNQISWSMY